MIVIRSIMVCTEEKDVKLLRAVAAEGVFMNSRAGSRERGALRQVVAFSLVAEGMPFISRSVRDRFDILTKKWRVKVRQEERESGDGDKEITEAEKLVEELVELEMESDKTKEQKDEAKKLVEGEKKKTIEMRERAMERFSQAKKRQEETEKDEGKKRKKEDEERQLSG